MLTSPEVKDSYKLALREWAYFAENNNHVMASIKFGELWAYGAVLQYDAYRISDDMAVARIGNEFSGQKN